jgi:hypothetical protein
MVTDYLSYNAAAEIYEYLMMKASPISIIQKGISCSRSP